MFFTSTEHKHRLLNIIQTLGKVYNGKLDQEYAAALYILTADESAWKAVQKYISRHGISFDKILANIHHSHGEETLVRLAGNLFNEQNGPVNAVDICAVLDEENFEIALSALQIRRRSIAIDDL